MGDPVPSSAISDSTTGGRSLITVSGGTDGDVLTQQADGTYAPESVSAGIGGSTGSTDNRVLRADGTGGNTIQNSAVTIDDSGNVTGVATMTASGDVSSGNDYGIFKTANQSRMELGTVSNFSSIYWGRPASGITRAFGWTDASQTFAVRIGGGYGWGSNTDASAATTTVIVQESAGCAAVLNIVGGSYRDFKARDITASGLMCAGTYTVATLPSASANAGKFSQVTDSSVTTFGSTVAGGGSTRVPVFSNGTNWVVA